MSRAKFVTESAAPSFIWRLISVARAQISRTKSTNLKSRAMIKRTRLAVEQSAVRVNAEGEPGKVGVESGQINLKGNSRGVSYADTKTTHE
jgi:hypothetical protein